ncbi:MAG: hypothetical protein ACLQDY_16810 [Streptosporangiaceae bacterium]
MTAATFGDVRGPAQRHLDAATKLTGNAADRVSITAAAGMTGCLALTLSRYLADIAPYDMAEAITSSELNSLMRAAVQAREALQLAAEGLRTSNRGYDTLGRGPADPLTAQLAAAAAALAAGRDLLRTHATTGTDGHWEPRSRWAGVTGSGPVTRALAAEVARWSKPLAYLTACLSAAAQADAATPAAITQGLAAATPLLLNASTTLTTAQHEHPATAADTELLHAVPVNHVPQPPPPSDNETVAALAAGIAVSAARVQALALGTVGQAAWAPELTAESWRWTATGAAIICDLSRLLLGSLTERAELFTSAPAVTAQLRAAADSAASACARWRAVRAAWQEITTDTRGLTAPAIPDTRDLIIRLGRLAFTEPRWTPVRARRAPPRDPADLAPDPAQAAVVTGAIHYAADTLASLADTDLHAVQTARRADRLYMPTRKLPEYYDVPYRHWKAPASEIAALLDAYQAASAASSRAATDLDALAVTMNAPSQILATARAATTSTARACTPPTAHSQRNEPVSEPVSRPGLAAPGPVEQAVRDLGAADLITLLRARAIDKAARKLLTEAKEDTREPGPPGLAEPRSHPAPPARTPAQLAAKSFPRSPTAPIADRQPASSPLPPHPAADDQAARPTPSRTYVTHGRLHFR